MRRRVLIAILGGAATLWPLAGLAQQPTQHRIAVVANIDPPEKMNGTENESWRAFFGELQRLGYVEGQNLIIERYSVEGHVDRHVDLAKGVISRNPELIVVFNITGVIGDAGPEIIGKRLQLLKEAIPSASRVALLLFEDDTRLPRPCGLIRWR
jgi:putative ABC transport system substrate-binding protein